MKHPAWPGACVPIAGALAVAFTFALAARAEDPLPGDFRLVYEEHNLRGTELRFEVAAPEWKAAWEFGYHRGNDRVRETGAETLDPPLARRLVGALTGRYTAEFSRRAIPPVWDLPEKAGSGAPNVPKVSLAVRLDGRERTLVIDWPVVDAAPAGIFRFAPNPQRDPRLYLLRLRLLEVSKVALGVAARMRAKGEAMVPQAEEGKPPDEEAFAPAQLLFRMGVEALEEIHRLGDRVLDDSGHSWLRYEAAMEEKKFRAAAALMHRLLTDHAAWIEANLADYRRSDEEATAGK
jgi:hypothetical protein